MTYIYIQLITDLYLYIPFVFRVLWHSLPASAALRWLRRHVPDVHNEADSDIQAVMLAICLWGVCNFAWQQFFPETAAIQYYSVLNHFKIKLYNII